MVAPVEFLKRIPLFQRFPSGSLEKVVPHLQRREYPQGTEFARQGEPGDALYLVESGLVGVYVRNARYGSSFLVGCVGPLGSWGEGAILLGKSFVTCVTIEASVLHRLPAETALGIAERVPTFALAMARALAEGLQSVTLEREVPWFSLAGHKLDPRLWSLAPDTLLRKGRMVPLALQGRTLTVGMVDPYDAPSIEALARTLPSHPLKVVAVAAEEYARIVDPENLKSVSGSARRSVPSSPVAQTQLTYLDDDEVWALRAPPAPASAAAGAQVVSQVDEIITQGLTLGASDIHIEHDRRGVLVRYRVDGALQPSSSVLQVELGKPLVSRLKLLARLDITETRKPQDGRISVNAAGRLVDLRVSTMPAKLGEKVVLRILDAEASITDLRVLFPVDKVRQLFAQLISRPQGLVLISGPTGSGKTTTLYSALHARRRPELNVVTVEDPIEYHLDGVTQVQVHPEAGVTFASVLRALLRQDPNIIMVGETRDVETARMAIEASMTGHLVLTSVHSNGAVEAVGRLADLGIERYAIANGLVGVLHQRLVRKNCPACREPMDYPESVVENLLKVGAFRAGEKLTLQRGRGCVSCGNTGFKGRIALYELLLITDAVRDAIGGTGELSQLRPVARAAGALVDMPRYAGALMALGHTAPGEVLHLVLRVGG